MKKLTLLAIAAAVMAGCCTKEVNEPALLDKAAFETTIHGKPVSLYTLRNAGGAALQLTNYGNRMVALWVPSNDGFRDVLWGYESIQAYLDASDAYSGPVVGRYGNRIAQSKFTLDGVEYVLTPNEGDNQLHGGPGGWSTKVWDAEEFTDADGNQAVKMILVSPCGDEGYPGTVTMEVTYTLTAGNEVVIDYHGTTDAPTVVNPTSHAYFNLHGTSASPSTSHVMTINADRYTPTDAELIPTGELAPVEGTPLDFRAPTVIGERIGEDFEALRLGGGYDHNWVLNKDVPGEVSLAAEVYEPATGIVMKVYTDQPGMQFYSGNFMDGTDIGKRGDIHNYRTGIALETQNFPDAPNHPDFPSAVLRPGEVYTQHTVYAFSIK